jgi:hypothetical protein
VTPAGFRRIALGLEGAVESAHHQHPDFRIGGRIFATLGYPDGKSGMVTLTPGQQQQYLREHATAFVRVNGTWGDQGATLVRLDAVDEETLGEAMTLAYQNAVSKRPVRPPTPARKAAPPVRTAGKASARMPRRTAR